MIIYPNAALNFLFLIFLLFSFTNSLTHNKKEHTLRFTEEKFLMDDIAKAEHNTLIIYQPSIYTGIKEYEDKE